MKHVYSYPEMEAYFKTGSSPFAETVVEKPIVIRVLRNHNKFYTGTKSPIQKEKDQRKGIYSW